MKTIRYLIKIFALIILITSVAHAQVYEGSQSEVTSWIEQNSNVNVNGLVNDGGVYEKFLVTEHNGVWAVDAIDRDRGWYDSEYVKQKCNSDGDCGTDSYIGDYYCKNGDVYRKYEEYECHYPGTCNSYCTSQTKEVLIDDCASSEVCIAGQPTCKSQTITCSYDSQCGISGYIGNYYCYNGDVYKDYKAYYCYNPGMINSYCGSSQYKVLMDDCSLNEYCQGGYSTCQSYSIACHTNADCGSNDYIGSYFCSNGDVSRKYRENQCINAGTANAYCTYTDSTKTVDDCGANEKCINGQSSCSQAACSKDEECGEDGYIENYYCLGGNVVRKYRDYTCKGAGSYNAYCAHTDSTRVVDYCGANEKCINGQSSCQTTSTACSTNLDCGTNGYVGEEYCRSGDLYRKYREYECKNAGTSTSYCTYHEEERFMDDDCDHEEECDLTLNVYPEVARAERWIHIFGYTNPENKKVKVYTDDYYTKSIYSDGNGYYSSYVEFNREGYHWIGVSCDDEMYEMPVVIQDVDYTYDYIHGAEDEIEIKIDTSAWNEKMKESSDKIASLEKEIDELNKKLEQKEKEKKEVVLSLDIIVNKNQNLDKIKELELEIAKLKEEIAKLQKEREEAAKKSAIPHIDVRISNKELDVKEHEGNVVTITVENNAGETKIFIVETTFPERFAWVSDAEVIQNGKVKTFSIYFNSGMEAGEYFGEVIVKANGEAVENFPLTVFVAKKDIRGSHIVDYIRNLLLLDVSEQQLYKSYFALPIKILPILLFAFLIVLATSIYVEYEKPAVKKIEVIEHYKKPVIWGDDWGYKSL